MVDKSGQEEFMVDGPVGVMAVVPVTTIQELEPGLCLDLVATLLLLAAAGSLLRMKE